jgi:stalled ribosome rescue protein Dom34
MSHSHAIVWMDSHEAHTFSFSANDVEKERVVAHSPFRKLHHKAGSVGAGHSQLEPAYLKGIADSLAGVEEWLLLGPGMAKHELAKYMQKKTPALWQKMAAIGNANHPTDGELLHWARTTFKKIDRMRSNAPA